MPKINVAESNINDEFAEMAAIIIAGIVAKDKLKGLISDHVSHVHALSGLEQYSGTPESDTRRIQYQINMTHGPETSSRKIESIYGASFCSMCHGCYFFCNCN